MSIIVSLNQMHHEAIEQIRAGSHNEFLVGFLTTSTMLELSNLVAADLDIEAYAAAAADVITQLAPVGGCTVTIDPDDFPGVTVTVGSAVSSAAGAGLAHGSTMSSGGFTLDGQATGEVTAHDVPRQLSDANFVQMTANQIGSGLVQILEAERLRRRAAVANTLALIAAFNDSWGQSELESLVGNLCLLPGATGATIAAGANRLAGVLSAEGGRAGLAAAVREFKVDQRLDVSVSVRYAAEPTAAQNSLLDEIVAVLSSNLTRIEENIRLAAEAETDQLTGLANRRRVAKALAAARAMSDRRNEKFSVLLVDLDHFKNVNDQLGHDAGDGVLVAFADMLVRSIRPFDTVVRWGGEEFLVICAMCGAAEAGTVAERIIAECAAACAAVLPEGWAQTASIGIAVYPDVARAPEALISAADSALYDAKRDGRNRYRRAAIALNA